MSYLTGRADRLTFDGTRVAVFGMTAGGRVDERVYWKGSDASDTVAVTAYTYDGLQRLSEIKAQDPTPTTLVHFKRAYDQGWNPRYTEYAHKDTRSEVYGTLTGANAEGATDTLGRLVRYRRGTLNGNKDDLTACVFEQDWHDTAGVRTLDKLGNWDLVRTDTSGGGTFVVESKGHNAANEYTSKNGQSAYDHDDTGNLTDDGTYVFGYDYANHLVKVTRKSDSAVIAQYTYDALGRRVGKVVTNPDTFDGGTAAAEGRAIRGHVRTGRPLGGVAFVERIGHLLGRCLQPEKRGPKKGNHWTWSKKAE